MVAPLVRNLADEAATQAVGAALGTALAPGAVAHLSGELGTGKTTLVRACLRALGFEDRVKSPTYTLVEPYELSKLSLYHFDFYRLTEPREWLDAGFRDYFDGTAVCLVEWPERAGPQLPAPDLHLRLEHLPQGRLLKAEASSEMGERLLRSISNIAG